MYIIKDKKTIETSNIYVVKNGAIREIKDIYVSVKNKIVQVWTSVKDFITSVFSAGYWMNDEGWNNEDSWKNLP